MSSPSREAIHFSLHREPFVAGVKKTENNVVIYVENTYLHSHILLFPFMHTPKNSIHIYVRIIIYGLDMQ